MGDWTLPRPRELPRERGDSPLFRTGSGVDRCWRRGNNRGVWKSGTQRSLALDAKLRRLLQDLRGAITEALAESSDVTRSMGRIREEGWSVYLVIDRKREDETPEGFELTTEYGSGEDPEFRIDSSDLAFLKALGIDPTRRVRRRR